MDQRSAPPTLQRSPTGGRGPIRPNSRAAPSARYRDGVPPRVFAYFVLFTVTALALALHAVSARREQSLGLGRIARVLTTTVATIFVFTLPAKSGRFDLGAFSVLQMVWLSVAVVAPATGIAVLLQRRAGRAVTRPARVAARLSLLMIPVAVYAMGIEPRRLQFETAQAAARIPLQTPLRIGVLSDIQCSRITDHERDAVARLMSERPDFIVIAGDLFQGTDAHFERAQDDFVALLRGLAAPRGVWVVRGDVDSDTSRRAYFDQITREAGVRVLVDEAARFEVRGQSVELYGFDRWKQDWAALDRFLRSPREPGFARIVLSHWPDTVLKHRDGMDVDLFIAGHTHGGQVVVPFFGPPMILSQVPRRIGAGGLHRVNGAQIYVSRGVGMERNHAPRVRFLCPPEVAVVTLASP